MQAYRALASDKAANGRLGPDFDGGLIGDATNPHGDRSLLLQGLIYVWELNRATLSFSLSLSEEKP